MWKVSHARRAKRMVVSCNWPLESQWLSSAAHPMTAQIHTVKDVCVQTVWCPVFLEKGTVAVLNLWVCVSHLFGASMFFSVGFLQLLLNKIKGNNTKAALIEELC